MICDKIAGIELYAAAVGKYFHCNTCAVTVCLCHFFHLTVLFRQHVIVVIASDKLQLLKISIYIPANWLCNKKSIGVPATGAISPVGIALPSLTGVYAFARSKSS